MVEPMAPQPHGNRDPERCERKFAWILHAEKINFVLEVVR
jgi:hypothetical protein